MRACRTSLRTQLVVMAHDDVTDAKGRSKMLSTATRLDAKR
jgi:hypothetical protein